MAAALAVLLPFLKAEYHLTFAEAGLLANLSYLGTFLTVLLAGWLVDKFGDRLVLVVGSVLTGLLAMLSALSPSFLILLGLILVMGAGIATPTPAGSSAVRSAFPLRVRGTVMGVRQTGIPLGGFVAALSLPMIAVTSGWRAAIFSAGLGATIVGIGVFLVYPRDRSVSPAARMDRRGPGLRSLMGRDVGVIAGAGILLVAAQFCLVTYLIAYLLQERRLSIAMAAGVLAVAQLAGAGGRILWGAISDRLLGGRRAVVLVLTGFTAAVGSLGLAVMPRGLALPLIVVIVIVFALGALGWNGIQISLLSELAVPGTEGRTVALGLMIIQPGIVLGPLLFGLVVDATQSFRLAWALLAAALIVATLILTRAHDAPLDPSSSERYAYQLNGAQ